MERVARARRPEAPSQECMVLHVNAVEELKTAAVVQVAAARPVPADAGLRRVRLARRDWRRRRRFRRATPRRTTMRSMGGRRRPNPTTRHNEIE